MAERYCLLLPHYCHVPQLRDFLPALAAVQLPALVIDDGSDPQTRTALQALTAQQPWAALELLPRNRGKGAAVIAGMQYALAQGFSHVIVVDADGQHDAAAVVAMHTASLAAPDSLFSGLPQFGSDIPKVRLYGRRITNALARIEACDPNLEDAMCGLRLYPLETVLPLCAQIGWRTRMELDTEILVRARWAGLPLGFIETPVRYPRAGRSHFRMVADNLRLTVMHLTLLALSVKQRLRPGANHARA